MLSKMEKWAGMACPTDMTATFQSLSSASIEPHLFLSLSTRHHYLHIEPHASKPRDLYVLNFDPIKYCSKPFSRITM